MRNIMSFNGITNADMGVVLTSRATVATPQERGESIEIPGRNGDLWRGEGAYSPIEIRVPICVLPDADFAAVRAWLVGSGALSFDGDEAYWDARISGDVHYSPRDFEGGYDSTITFVAQPFRSVAAVDIPVTTSPQTVINPCAVYSEPLITVVCNGSFEIRVNDTILSVADLSGTVKLDTQQQEAYMGDQLVNNSMVGAFPVLRPGINTVSYSGAITSLTITPRWRKI